MNQAMSPTTISPEFSPSAQLRRTPKSARHQTKRGHPCAPEVAYHPDKAIPNLPTQPCLFVPIETAIRSLGDACLSFDKPNQTKKQLKLIDGASLWPIRSRELPVLSTPVQSPDLSLSARLLGGCWTLNSGPYDVKASTSPAEPAPQPQPLYFQRRLLFIYWACLIKQ